jgi:phosphate transporter
VDAIDITDGSYDALKKLFPETPLDPSYFSTQQHQESTSLLPTIRTGSDKWASPEEFRAALDKERQKVQDFYNTKLEEIRSTFGALEEEVRGMEDRELGEDIIKEEDEEEEEFRETDDLLSPGMAPPPRPSAKSRTSFMNRMAPSMGRRRKSILPTAPATTHEADLHEGTLRTQRSRSTGRVSFSADDGTMSPKALGRGRRSSDFESSEDGPSNARDRRTSLSSTSSHDRDINLSVRSNLHSLGLVVMDPSEVPDWLYQTGRDEEEDTEQKEPVYIWTGSGNYGTFARIALKKKISRVWLDTYSLKQYVDLNLTAFEKILKKYDKNTNSKVCRIRLNHADGS